MDTRIRKFIYSLLLGLGLGCQSTLKEKLATNSDYQLSQSSLKSSKVNQAIDAMPQKEKGGFIHTVEYTWLNLLKGTPDPSKLAAIMQIIEERKTFKVSDSLVRYFYSQYDDGYYPAEHEVIFAHLIAGLSFAMLGDFSSARVEARRASGYLQGNFDDKNQGFDDAGLRILSGALWYLLDDWQHARVDWRVAAKLQQQFLYFGKAAENPDPPQELHIVFAGSGPDVLWKPQFKMNFIEGLKGVHFEKNFPKIQLHLRSDQENIRKSLGTGHETFYWYQRHGERNHAIKDVMDDSIYMASNTMNLIGATSVMTMTVGAAALVAAAGIGVSYLLFTKAGWLFNNDAMAAIGFMPAIAGVVTGYRFLKKGYKSSSDTLEDTLNRAELYRFVRFIPDRVYGLPLQNKTGDMVLESEKERDYQPAFVISSREERGRAFFYYLADTNRSYKSYAWGWQDPVTGLHWYARPKKLNQTQARQECGSVARQSQADGHRLSMRLPSYEEAKEAIINGLADSVNANFKAALQDENGFWLEGECQFLDKRSLSAVKSDPCLAIKRSVWCVEIYN